MDQMNLDHDIQMDKMDSDNSDHDKTYMLSALLHVVLNYLPTRLQVTRLVNMV